MAKRDDVPAYRDPNVDRIPPNSLEAEMALLGAVLCDRENYDVAAEIVRGSDFYAPLHEAIWMAISAVAGRGTPVDKVSLAEELRTRGMLDKVGGLAYLTLLMDYVTTTASTSYYARLIREKAALRGLIHAGDRIMTIGYEGESDAPAALAEAEAALSSVVIDGAAPSPIESGATVLDRLEREVKNGRREDAVYTPWAGLNRLTGGLLAGELIAVPAAPSIGKSGFVLCIGEYVAARKGAVLLAALEMGVDSTHRRRIAQRANVSARAQRIGKLESADRQQIYLAVRELRSRPFFVTGDGHSSLASIWRAAREVVRQAGPLKLLIVDQMGWIADVNREAKGTTRNDRKSAAYLSLISLGREFGCPVMAVDHLNRDGMKERPSFATLAKIRDGGNVEGHAHHVVFPWRPDPLNNATLAEAIVAKSRDGAAGAVPMWYDGARALWCEANDDGDPIRPWFEFAARDTASQGFDLVAVAAAQPSTSDRDDDPSLTDYPF